jgi:hypothetical protein
MNDEERTVWTAHDIFGSQCFKLPGDDTVYMIVVNNNLMAADQLPFHIVDLNEGILGTPMGGVDMANYLNKLKAEPCTRFDG